MELKCAVKLVKAAFTVRIKITSVIMAKRTGSANFSSLFPKVTDEKMAMAPKGAKFGGCGSNRLTATSVTILNKVEVVFLVIFAKHRLYERPQNRVKSAKKKPHSKRMRLIKKVF